MSLVAAVPAVQIKSVVVATDFSKASEKPLRHALAIARHFKAKFTVVHVVSSLGFVLGGPGCVAAAVDAARRDARDLEQGLLQQGSLDGVDYGIVVRDGEVEKELEAVVREQRAELLVIGTHSRQGVDKLLFGSVAERVFRGSGCLVLTVGPGSFKDPAMAEPKRAMRPFLFATGFDAASEHALPYAVSFANQFGVELALLHVVPDIPLPEGSRWCTASDVQKLREAARNTTLAQLQQFVSPDLALAARPEFLVEFGPASEGIVRASETLRPEVIIMGLKRTAHIGTASHMPWATAYEVVCKARCPVLTIRC